MDGDGPVRQRIAIERYALAHNIEIVGWFQESHTGSDLEGRTAFREMRAALLSDGVSVVIVEKLDRLARDVMIQETIISDFKKNCIVLRSATPGEDDLCGNDPTRTMIRQILAAFYEYERKMISSKLRAGAARKKQQTGRCSGRKPYGYMSGGNRQAEIPNPAEYPTFRLIMDLRDEGYNADYIALKLTALDLKSRDGKPWRASVIRKILSRHRVANPCTAA
jgi:DNA invertase Pin-like site-specific DNA recombinase